VSSITGEIGYKIGSPGNVLPWVGGRTITSLPGQNTLTLNGTASHYALTVNGGLALSAAPSLGAQVIVSAASTDTALMLKNTAGTVIAAFKGDTTGQIGFNSQAKATFAWDTAGAVTFNCGAGSFTINAAFATTTYFAFNNTGLSIENIVAGAQQLAVYENGGATKLAFSVSQVSLGPAVTTLGTSAPYTWVTGTNYPILQLAGVGAMFGTGTVGVVLTGGGLYWNGTNYVYGQAGTGVQACLGTGSFTVSCVNTSGTAASVATPTVVFSIGGTVTSNKIQGYGPTAAGLVDMTPDTGSFNGTGTGFSPAPIFACKWSKMGNIVIITVTSTQGTSNATTWSIGQLPAAITPVTSRNVAVPFLQDSGASTNGAAQANSGGFLQFYKGASTSGGWTASGQKGLAADNSFFYQLN
jgi:hypothetical protein